MVDLKLIRAHGCSSSRSLDNGPQNGSKCKLYHLKGHKWSIEPDSVHEQPHVALMYALLVGCLQAFVVAQSFDIHCDLRPFDGRGPRWIPNPFCAKAFYNAPHSHTPKNPQESRALFISSFFDAS